MTAATQDKLIYGLNDDALVLPALRSFPVAASKKLYEGAIVGLDSSGNAGPADGTTYTVVVGLAQKQADNSSGNAGDIQVLVRRGTFGNIAQSGTTIDKTKVGQKVYAIDDSTLTLTSTSNAFAGYVDYVDTQSGVVFYLIGQAALV